MRISDWSSDVCSSDLSTFRRSPSLSREPSASSSPSRRKTIASAQVTGAAPHRRCSAPDTVPRLIRAAWTLRKRQSDLCSLRPVSLSRIFLANQLSVIRPPRPPAATTKAPKHEPAHPNQRRDVLPHGGGSNSSSPRLIPRPHLHSEGKK